MGAWTKMEIKPYSICNFVSFRLRPAERAAYHLKCRWVVPPSTLHFDISEEYSALFICNIKLKKGVALQWLRQSQRRRRGERCRRTSDVDDVGDGDVNDVVKLVTFGIRYTQCHSQQWNSNSNDNNNDNNIKGFYDDGTWKISRNVDYYKWKFYCRATKIHWWQAVRAWVGRGKM